MSKDWVLYSNVRYTVILNEIMITESYKMVCDRMVFAYSKDNNLISSMRVKKHLVKY